MKKQPLSILLWITLIFGAFCLGFFLGRSREAAPVQVTAANTAPQVTIPETTEETAPAKPPVTYPVNINTADGETLEALPGIGAVLAERILRYRSENGSFSSPEELLNVEGIGAGKLEKMLDYITTGG